MTSIWMCLLVGLFVLLVPCQVAAKPKFCSSSHDVVLLSPEKADLTLANAEAAERLCEDNGLAIASRKQLREAGDDGLSICRCGWLSNGVTGYPKGRGKDPCVVKNFCRRSRLTIATYDAWCYKGTACDKSSKAPCSPNPCKNGGACTEDGTTAICTCPVGFKGPHCKTVDCSSKYDVVLVHSERGPDVIKSDTRAKRVCEENSMTLATFEQLKEAQVAGLTVCHCGWLSDGTARYPMGPEAESSLLCGRNNEVHTCVDLSWAGVGRNAWCFREPACKRTASTQ